MRTVAAIVGPTGVGKTEIAIKIALRWGVSIVSCDARQVYKYMDIGTAKPNKKIRNTVSHYMIDIVEPNERYTAYDYARDGRKVIGKLESPIIVGGSGLYLSALIDGL
ncbi:tRNA (adenosine(37)-N6)-dimethylallyltransferase MiaA, partial [candidate division WOR-3 bacterium]|nr:tRNA (adenosine(37)-N6)-dimethylallyltransferase MiaA [candidate division WOR-3 bacterium]